MRSSLFKPVIMPGRSTMWRGDPSWELRRLKTRGLELAAAVSTEAQQLGQGGLVLTCNPDPG